MKGYKVFTKDRRGGLKSCVVSGMALIRYRKDRFSRAPVWLYMKGYHPTFFSNLKNAKKFYKKECWQESEKQLWKVECKDIVCIPDFLDYRSLNIGIIARMVDLWPNGTKMAKLIKPVKRII